MEEVNVSKIEVGYGIGSGDDTLATGAEAARQAEEHFRALVENVSDIIMALNDDGTIRYISPSIEQTLGHKPEDLIGTNSFDLIHPDDRPSLLGPFAQGLQDPDYSACVEFRARHRDGSWRVLEAVGKNRLDDPVVAGIIVNARDITERVRMQEAVRESEEKYRDLVNTLTDLVFTVDIEGNILFANSSAKEFTGYEPEETIGHNFVEYVHPDDVPGLFAGIQQVLSGEPLESIRGVGYDSEYRMVKQNGEVIWVATRSRPIRGAQGEIIGFSGINRNITDRVRAEKRIECLNRLNEDLLGPGRLDEKLKRITDGVVTIFDADFARIWITKPGDLCDAGCSHAGVTEGPHACRSRDRCLHLVASSGRYTHTDGEVHRRVPFGYYRIGRVAAGEEPKFITNDATHDPGVHDHDWARELGLVSFAGYRLLSATGEPIGVLALFSQHVISPEKDRLLEGLANTTAQVIQTARAEEALKESEEKFRTLAEQSPSMIFINQRGGVVYANERCEEVTGYTRDEFYSADFDFLTLIAPEHRELVKTSFSQHRKGEEVEPYEYTLVTKDGERVEAIITTRLIDYEGERAILGTVTDISERVRAEVALRQYAVELEARNEELDAFAHTVAHDLKNPLTQIIGFTELLQEDHIRMPGDELYHYLGMIVKNGRRMDSIIDELLLLSSVRKAEEIETHPLDMARIVAEVQDRLTPMIKEYQAEIILPLEGAWPVALGYAPWIEQVWVNYLSNALKYGGRPPRVELGATEQADGTVCFWICDNGPGIPPEDQAHLLIPFTRLDQIHARGYGLGLSIVRRIVEKLGGQVGVESQPGQGSTFIFTLPGVRQ